MLSSFGSSIPASTNTALSPAASNLSDRLPVLYSKRQFYSFGGFGVMFRPKPNLCYCTLAVTETRPKPHVRSVSAPLPKPKPNFGRTLQIRHVFRQSHNFTYILSTSFSVALPRQAKLIQIRADND